MSKTYQVTAVHSNGHAHSTSAEGFYAEQLMYNLYDRQVEDKRVNYVGLFEVYDPANREKPTVLIKQNMRFSGTQE